MMSWQKVSQSISLWLKNCWKETCILDEEVIQDILLLKYVEKYWTKLHLKDTSNINCCLSSSCKHQFFLTIHHLPIHFLPSSHPGPPLSCVSPPCPSGCGGPAWPWQSFPCRWSWAGGSCRCAAAHRSRRRWSSCTGHPASGWTGWWPCLSGSPPATHAGRKWGGGVKERWGGHSLCQDQYHIEQQQQAGKGPPGLSAPMEHWWSPEAKWSGFVPSVSASWLWTLFTTEYGDNMLVLGNN